MFIIKPLHETSLKFMRKTRNVLYISKRTCNVFYTITVYVGLSYDRFFSERSYLGIKQIRFSVNRTLVASLMLSLTCRVSKDCAHTRLVAELMQRRALRSATFVRRDRRKRGDTFSSARRFICDLPIIRKGASLYDLEDSIASFSSPPRDFTST